MGSGRIFISPGVARILTFAAFALVLLVSAAAAYFFNEDMNKAKWQSDAWMNPVITQKEERAMQWVRENTVEREVFVTDIFGGEHLMGETLREGTEGGDWAIVPEVVPRMSDVNEFFKTSDSAKAHEIAKKYGANFALIPDRQLFAGFEWLSPDRSKFSNSDYFEMVYQDGEMQIFEIK
ncbi:hypothetical protein HY989_05235 [Candidatus Micrarchaeota archaeon]|nr:hypothetical protein [Candidatus Micrarchaeota archaeon]